MEIHPDSFSNITILIPRYNEFLNIRCECSVTLQDAIHQVSKRDLSKARLFDSTYSTKRELGPPEICLNQNLEQLRLWPSAKIEVVFPGDLEENWTLSVKSVKNPTDLVSLNYVRALDTIEQLKKRIASKSEQMSPASSLNLIFGGKVLKDEDTLIFSGLNPDNTVLCLKRDHAPSTPSVNSVFQTTPHEIDSPPIGPIAPTHIQSSSFIDDVAVDDGPPVCRICFGNAEDSPLITPCRCRGSIRCVHLECLNSWRRLAPTEASFARCDQCGYEYRFERTRLAEFLLSDIGGWSIALSICIMLLYIGAFVNYYLPSVLRQFVEKYSWVPTIPPVLMMGNRPLYLYQWSPMAWSYVNEHLQFLKGGTFVFAVLGLSQYILDEFLHWFVHRQLFGGWGNMHSAMVLCSLCSFHSRDLSRIVVVVGFFGCARLVALNVHVKSRALAQWLGERMLAVE